MILSTLGLPVNVTEPFVPIVPRWPFEPYDVIPLDVPCVPAPDSANAPTVNRGCCTRSAVILRVRPLLQPSAVTCQIRGLVVSCTAPHCGEVPVGAGLLQ